MRKKQTVRRAENNKMGMQGNKKKGEKIKSKIEEVEMKRNMGRNGILGQHSHKRKLKMFHNVSPKVTT